MNLARESLGQRVVSRLLRALPPLNFAGSANYFVRYRGRRLRLSRSDYKSGANLSALVADRQRAERANQSPKRLVAHRELFRHIIRLGRFRGLLPCLRGNQPELTRLALWLMSKVHVVKVVPEINALAGHADVRVRRDVARALRRLNAWHELADLARHDPDPQVRRLATPRAARPLQSRLAEFSRHASRVETPRRARWLTTFFMPQTLGPGQPPKSPALIRAILLHIHRLVRGA